MATIILESYVRLRSSNPIELHVRPCSREREIDYLDIGQTQEEGGSGAGRTPSDTVVFKNLSK